MRTVLFAAGISLATALILPVGNNDFPAYWIAGQRLIADRNPYALAEILSEEMTQFGVAPGVALNPPWSVAVFYPLGRLSYNHAQRLWTALMVFAWFLSVEIARQLYAPHFRTPTAWMMACVFSPFTAMVGTGQMSSLILLGVLSFVWNINRGREVEAGICLYLVALKPQLAYLVWPLLLLWTIKTQRWKIIAAFAVTVTAISIAAMAVHPPIFSEYLHLWTHETTATQAFPTLGGLLRVATGIGWMQIVPMLLALAWLACRRFDGWQRAMPSLLAVSVATSPYGWFFDQVVAFPSIMERVRGWRSAAIIMIVNVVTLVMIAAHSKGFWYAWTGIAWVAFYFGAPYLEPKLKRCPQR